MELLCFHLTSFLLLTQSTQAKTNFIRCYRLNYAYSVFALIKINMKSQFCDKSCFSFLLILLDSDHEWMKSQDTIRSGERRIHHEWFMNSLLRLGRALCCHPGSQVNMDTWRVNEEHWHQSAPGSEHSHHSLFDWTIQPRPEQSITSAHNKCQHSFEFLKFFKIRTKDFLPPLSGYKDIKVGLISEQEIIISVKASCWQKLKTRMWEECVGSWSLILASAGHSGLGWLWSELMR